MTRSPSLNTFSLFPGPNYYIGFICFVSVLLSQTHSQALSLSAIHPSDTVSHIRKHHFHFFLGYLHPGNLDSPTPVCFICFLSHLFPESNLFLFFLLFSHFSRPHPPVVSHQKIYMGPNIS